MLQVGYQYENRKGKYILRSVCGDVASIEYESGEFVKGSLELLDRIYTNITDEREVKQLESATQRDYELLRDRLRVYGCNIFAHCNLAGLARLSARYEALTGEKVAINHPGVSVHDYNWSCPAMKVTCSKKVAVPLCYEVSENATHGPSICSTGLAWQLIVDGFRLGSNRMR